MRARLDGPGADAGDREPKPSTETVDSLDAAPMERSRNGRNGSVIGRFVRETLVTP
ncbi:hypothetical protein [Natronococcus jeotgali]|uniref:hypothetical protein n=1 Tax=Natronococcus jeotgali TaxID=413812 RepID=UPI001360B0C7|nr:hypothetical protein [Natronococcus jeotgali]